MDRAALAAFWPHNDAQRRHLLRISELWQEHGLVFASRVGTPLTANNVIRAFGIITKKAGLGEDWVPREMRHTFVSVQFRERRPRGEHRPADRTRPDGHH